MKTYRTNDGEQITVSTVRDLIKALRKAARSPEPSLRAFMMATALRAHEQTGVVVSTATEAQFIAGLIQAGLLTEEPE